MYNIINLIIYKFLKIVKLYTIIILSIMYLTKLLIETYLQRVTY